MFKVSYNVEMVSIRNKYDRYSYDLTKFVKLGQVEDYFGSSLDTSRPANEIITAYIKRGVHPPSSFKENVKITSMEFINPNMRLANIGRSLLRQDFHQKETGRGLFLRGIDLISKN